MLLKTAIVVLVCNLLLLSCGGSRSQTSPKQVGTSDSLPLFTPHKATLAQQKMCDEQAVKRFNEYTAKENRDKDSYTSHYDPTVNVCYVRINQMSVERGMPSNSTIITDAFEGRIYATYIWSNPGRKKYWEVAPMDCQVNVPGKDSVKCTSMDEFDSLTEKYFGIAK